MPTFNELLEQAAQGQAYGVSPTDSPSSALTKKRRGAAPGAPTRKHKHVSRRDGDSVKCLKLEHETIEQNGTPTAARTNEHTTSDKALDKPDILTDCKRVDSTRSKGPTPALQKLVFNLQIETTNTSPQHGALLNRFEEPDSAITSLHAGTLEYFDRARNACIQLTTDERHKPAYMGKKLVLESVWQDQKGRIVDTTRREYTNEDKDYFTVKEVVKRIVDFERIDRPKSQWFGGIDCHHIFFEGLRPNSKRDAFQIRWGS
jgi:hypothetical protein